MPIWARAVGTGSIRRDFGHQIATNTASEVLLAARVDRLDHDPGESDAHRSNTGFSADTAHLIKLARTGGPAWSLLVRDVGRRHAPAIALDPAGAAYLAGPYAPDDTGFRGGREVTISRVGPCGGLDWSRPLFLAPAREKYVYSQRVAVATDRSGGACVVWLGERRKLPVLRALRFSRSGSIDWAHVWPITGEAFQPYVFVDAAGAALVGCRLHGTVSFGAAGDIDSTGVASFGATNHPDSLGEAIALARLDPSGGISWIRGLPLEEGAPHAACITSDGALAFATVVPSPVWRENATRRVFTLRRWNARGEALKVIRGLCEPHTAMSSLSIDALSGGGLAIAGYFSGGLRLGPTPLRSLTPAHEAAFVAAIDPSGHISTHAFPMPQLCAGLSVHTADEGSLFLAGWACGAVLFGLQKVPCPSGRAVLFLTKMAYSPSPPEQTIAPKRPHDKGE